MKQAIILTTIITLLFSACEKTEVNTQFNSTNYWNAHYSQAWDSTSTSNHLIGTWTWVYNYCCPEGNSQIGRRTEMENLKIKIDTLTIEVFKNGEYLQITNWNLELEDGDLFGIQMDKSFSQIHGRILFFDKNVLFNNSYKDGENNYFRKD